MLLCEASTTAGSRLATAVPELVMTAAGRLQDRLQGSACLPVAVGVAPAYQMDSTQWTVTYAHRRQRYNQNSLQSSKGRQLKQRRQVACKANRTQRIHQMPAHVADSFVSLTGSCLRCCLTSRRVEAYPVARAWPRAQKAKERSSMQEVTRALGCIATASVNADDLDPAGATLPVTADSQCSN